jgi:hypothetical protein
LRGRRSETAAADRYLGNQIARCGKPTDVAFVSNHFAGYAPKTVRQLVALRNLTASA